MNAFGTHRPAKWAEQAGNKWQTEFDEAMERTLVDVSEQAVLNRGPSKSAAREEENFSGKLAPSGHATPTNRSSKGVVLGKGGLWFVRRGKHTLAEACSDKDTADRVRVSYGILSAELAKLSALVKAQGGKITGPELKKQFRSSPIAAATDDEDWAGWANDFSPGNPDRGRPKGAALTFLERKTNFKRGTLKTYLSRSRIRQHR